MKTAILIHGNLRTFLMPLREDAETKISDRFVRQIINNNDVDIFIFTDTSDFFYNGFQHYPIDKKIEVLNNDSWRIHERVKFIEHEQAKEIIDIQLRAIFGDRLKLIHIESPYDPKTDPKYQILYDANMIGSSPSLLIHQWRKLKLCYEMLKEYELKSGIKYENFVKWRFDILVPENPLKFTDYDMNNIDLYTAGGYDPIVYDWYAFGKRPAIETYMNLYDHLGCFLDEGPVFMYECKACQKRFWVNTSKLNCTYCSSKEINSYEITLAPEYHLFRLHQSFKTSYSKYAASPYRYGDTSVKKPLDHIVQSIGSGVTIITHTAGRDSTHTTYEG